MGCNKIILMVVLFVIQLTLLLTNNAFIYYINIDYDMVFVISYPLSARGHDISPRESRYVYYILQQRK